MEKRSTPIYNVLKCWVLQYIYWNRGFPGIDNRSDGGTETIDSNIFKSSQSKSYFQIQPIKCPVQNNEISTAYTTMTTLSLINKLSSSNLQYFCWLELNYMLHLWGSYVHVRVSIINIYHQSKGVWFRVWILSWLFTCKIKETLQMVWVGEVPMPEWFYMLRLW